MRMTGSRAYTRPTPVPKMPPGLVDLMESLSKEVLRNNPSDVYGFCATHMQKLLEIRDGPITKQKQSLSLDQKIANAQEKVRQRAERRRQKYDNEAKLQCGKEVGDNVLPDPEKNLEDQILIQNTLKLPVYHELGLADASEIEISHEPASNCIGTDVVKYNEQNNDDKELASETETIIDDKKKLNDDKIILPNIECTNDEVIISNVPEKCIDSDDCNKTVEPGNESIVGQKGTESTVAQKCTESIVAQKDTESTVAQKGTESTVAQKGTESTVALKDTESTVAHKNTESTEAQKDTESTVAQNDTESTVAQKDTESTEAQKDTESTVAQKDTESIVAQKDTESTVAQKGTESAVAQKDTESTVAHKDTESTEAQKDTESTVAQKETGVKNLNTNSVDNEIPKDNTEKIDSEVVSEPDCLNNIIEDTVQKATISSSDMTNSEMSKKEEIYVKGDETINIEQIDTQSTYVEAELHQENDSYNNSESIKQTKMELDKNIASESNTTEPHIYIISKEQEIEPKLDVILGQNQIEKVINDIDTKADLESENANLPDKIFEEHQNDTEKSNEITNDSQNPIELVKKAENKSLETLISTDIILSSVAGDESVCQIDNIKTNNEKTPEIADDINLLNVETLTSIHKEILDSKDIHNNEDTSSEMRATELIDEKVVEKSNMDGNNETDTSIITTEDTPKVKDMIRNDVHESSNMDLETAAITIQKVFRTFLFKSRASTFEDSVNNEVNSMEEDNENKDECDYPITSPLKDRRSLGITRMDTVLQTVNEEKSLSLSTDDSSTLSSAATIIQAHVRGYLVRNKLNSNKTASSNSVLNSDGRTNSTSLDNDNNNLQKKTVLNIHIVPEGGNLSRDESIITSIELSLDGSPPSSINLHPLGYDISERRKQLKREDAFQSISPPSNNSGKLSEEVDSVIEQCVTDGNDSQLKNDPIDTTDVDVHVINVAENAINEAVSNVDNTRHGETEKELINKRKSLIKMSSDEMDVVTPFGESAHTNVSNSENTPKLLHSGEMHDIALPTKVSRSDTSVVRGE